MFFTLIFSFMRVMALRRYPLSNLAKFSLDCFCSNVETSITLKGALIAIPSFEEVLKPLCLAS